MVDKKTDVTRNYGIDMLRILCMFFVCFLHVLGRGGILEACVDPSFKHAVIWLFEIAAYGAVNAYALISGFVGYKSKFKYSNIIYLYCQVVFYMLGTTALFSIFMPESVSTINFVSSVFPFAFDTYWYFTAYFGLFFFIPILNIFIDKAYGRIAGHFFGVVIALFCILPIVFQNDIYSLRGGYSIIWLAVLYVIGGFIKKYEIAVKLSRKASVLGYIVCTVITWSLMMGIEVLTTVLFGTVKGNTFFISYTSPFVLCQAIMLVLFASKLKLSATTIRFVKFFAPVTFGVYLIHEQPLITNTFIVGKFAEYTDSSCVGMVAAAIGTALCIWFICSVIDRGRLILFDLINVKGGAVCLEKKLRKYGEKIYKTIYRCVFEDEAN